MAGTDSFPRQHARTQRFTLGAPRSITVSPDGERVVFCRSSHGTDTVNALWVLDVTTGVERCVADPRLLGADDADLPAEERARRERAREAGGGIVRYACDRGVELAAFTLGGQLFTIDLVDAAAVPVGLPAQPGAFDPRPSPDASLVAYVADGALYVTAAAGPDRCIAAADDPDSEQTWGVAEFIAAEEMGRSRGYWWSPDGTTIAATRVDPTAVDRWHIASPIEPWAEPNVVRYPAAGTTNASVELHLIPIAEPARTTRVDWAGADFEYLADVQWPANEPLTIVTQTRDQRTVAVATVDAATGATTERYRYTDPAWVELIPGAPCWVDGRLLTVEDRGNTRRLVLDGVDLTPGDVQVRSVIAADGDTIWFEGTMVPSESHVATVTLDGVVTLVSQGHGVHHAVVGGPTSAISTSSLDHDGAVTLVHRDGEVVATIASYADTPLVTPVVQLSRGGERQLPTAVLFPTDDPGGALPVLLDPYGGPHAQRVVAARNAHGVSQWFADQGFCVVVIDGRGTPARGPEWERAVRGDLAGPVLEDQIDGLLAAAEAYPGRLDLGRVAIRGWSFGGYLAALAVLARPDVFHAAIAGAPVTDWRLYDTHYTERYLGHPDTDPANYERTNLVPLAPRLERPLLLIHGLADDNVVAAHTLVLSRALLEAGRPHQVLPLSGVTHMTPQEEVAENLLRLQLDFLRASLGE
jgi:dipeptidyl-peptidase 4